MHKRHCCDGLEGALPFLMTVFGICFCIKYNVQSGASGLAKNGGAYFSAVYGSVKDPIAAPGPYEQIKYWKLVGIALNFMVQHCQIIMVPLV